MKSLGPEGFSVPNVFTALNISQGENSLLPEFNPERFHYAIRCIEGSELSLSFSVDPSQTVLVNGKKLVSPALLNPVSDTQNIEIEVQQRGETQKYSLQCMPADFLNIEVTSEAAFEHGETSLYALSPRYKVNGSVISFLLIIDDLGIPRFLRRINAAVTNFRPSPDGGWSYLEVVGKNEYGWNDSRLVVLDSDFHKVREVETVGLNQTDNHESFVTPSGTFVLSSYNTAFRDMTQFNLSDTEETRDSVVQEVTGDGEIVFEWNSWGKLDLANCQVHRWPDDYAHLNSVSVSSDGNFILSLRGCSQVLKVDRESGATIWVLGGARNNSFDIVGDPFGEFCGQHTAFETSSGNIGMFDNGGYCNGGREENFGQFSRYVEYKLDMATRQASFVRDYSLYNAHQWYTNSGGSVQETAEGTLLINWGRIPEVSATEVVDNEIVRRFRLSWKGDPVRTYRFYKLGS